MSSVEVQKQFIQTFPDGFPANLSWNEPMVDFLQQSLTDAKTKEFTPSSQLPELLSSNFRLEERDNILLVNIFLGENGNVEIAICQLNLRFGVPQI
eukprot:UN07027